MYTVRFERLFSMASVGAQWELRRALARTDQRLGRYDASVRAHIDRRFPRVSALLGSFSNEHGQQPFRIEVLDAKCQIHRAPARPATGRRDRGQVRRRPTEVSTCHSAPAIPIAPLHGIGFGRHFRVEEVRGK